MCLDKYNKHSLEAKQVIYYILKTNNTFTFHVSGHGLKKLRLEVPLALLLYYDGALIH